jgi:transcriptional regulator with XRE-family HTH domain
MYGDKIKTIRELRGYSQEYLSGKLGIAQNTYSKIETGQTKLSVDVLNKIADVLGVSPEDIISNQPAIINFKLNSSNHENNTHEKLTELVEKIIASKDSEIQHLKEIITSLLKDKEVMFQRSKR